MEKWKSGLKIFLRYRIFIGVFGLIVLWGANFVGYLMLNPVCACVCVYMYVCNL